MPRRRDAVQPLRHAAGGGDLGTDLGPGQHAAVAGLGALRELELDHLHLRIARVGGETFLAEAAVLLAAAEVARADFPDQVAARSEEHTSELQSLMRISYAVFCLKKNNKTKHQQNETPT